MVLAGQRTGQESLLSLGLTLVTPSYICSSLGAHNFDLFCGRRSRAGLAAMITQRVVFHMGYVSRANIQSPGYLWMCCGVASPQKTGWHCLAYFFLNKNTQAQIIHIIFRNSLADCSAIG